MNWKSTQNLKCLYKFYYECLKIKINLKNQNNGYKIYFLLIYQSFIINNLLFISFSTTYRNNSPIALIVYFTF